MAKYRTKDSFISKDPVKLSHSRANLKRGTRPGTLQKVLTKPKQLEQASIIEFATDPLFLGLSFKKRPAQEVVLRSIYGMPLNDDQLKIYQKITKNKKEFEAGIEKVEAFLSYELVVNSLKLAGDLPFKSEFQYFAGIDASGLAGRDKFSLAIAHEQGNDIYVDLVKSWDLKDSSPIMSDIKELAKMYNFVGVSIDRYARGWVQNSLEKIGLEVSIRPSLAEIYVNVKGLMIGDRLFLPDNKGIKKSFLNTQAFYGRNNALSIAHPRDSEGHADEIDAISTAVFEVTREQKEPEFVVEGSSAGRRLSSYAPEDAPLSPDW
ncbi:hypothetical protein ES705_21952 [subsurface metagenome]